MSFTSNSGTVYISNTSDILTNLEYLVLVYAMYEQYGSTTLRKKVPETQFSSIFRKPDTSMALECPVTHRAIKLNPVQCIQDNISHKLDDCSIGSALALIGTIKNGTTMYAVYIADTDINYEYIVGNVKYLITCPDRHDIAKSLTYVQFKLASIQYTCNCMWDTQYQMTDVMTHNISSQEIDFIIFEHLIIDQDPEMLTRTPRPTQNDAFFLSDGKTITVLPKDYDYSEAPMCIQILMQQYAEKYHIPKPTTTYVIPLESVQPMPVSPIPVSHIPTLPSKHVTTSPKKTMSRHTFEVAIEENFTRILKPMAVAKALPKK
jgi:hypothetical protein